MTPTPGAAERVRVVIVEDDPRYRGSLETLLTHADGFRLAGSFGNPLDLLAEARRAASVPAGPGWDLILMDLHLPGMSGIEATRRLKEALPDVLIVVLTVFEEPATILDAICAGADGYLLKKTRAPEMLEQLRSVAGGGAALTSRVARTVLGLVRDALPAPAGTTPPGGPPIEGLELTPRERDVLRCLVEGMAYKEAGSALKISVETVRVHIRNIYRKLQVHNVAEAVSRAIRDRLT